VAIYLINLRGDYATLQAASSEGGKRLAERGYRLRVGVEGIVGFVAAEKKPRMALDVGEDAFYFDSSDLPDTRSELALPLIVRSQVIGVLDMQSTEVQAFQYDEIDMFQTLADQIAVAIENARLLSESELTISQLEVISSENTLRNWQLESIVRKPAFRYSATGVHPIEKVNPAKGKYVLDVPLMLHGQRIGKISLHRKEGFRNWTAQEKTVAAKVANQTALALENIRLVENTRQRANREKAIASVSARIRETLDLDTVLRTSAREIQNALNLQEVEIRLIPQDNQDDKKESEKTQPS
jgi:GAF domain-containing protein